MEVTQPTARQLSAPRSPSPAEGAQLREAPRDVAPLSRYRARTGTLGVSSGFVHLRGAHRSRSRSRRRTRRRRRARIAGGTCRLARVPARRGRRRAWAKRRNRAMRAAHGDTTTTGSARIPGARIPGDAVQQAVGEGLEHQCTASTEHVQEATNRLAGERRAEAWAHSQFLDHVVWGPDQDEDEWANRTIHLQGEHSRCRDRVTQERAAVDRAIELQKEAARMLSIFRWVLGPGRGPTDDLRTSSEEGERGEAGRRQEEWRGSLTYGPGHPSDQSADGPAENEQVQSNKYIDSLRGDRPRQVPLPWTLSKAPRRKVGPAHSRFAAAEHQG